ncbi:hypothetical protein BC374_20885 [Ensifer sp. LC13]|nr:hypothetical protein BC362_26755 [Ensifer sp. LC14]OCP08876.1 hypothetical protein BC374_20885 [Ensifer sp. LC13]OCP32245.1 hypothetical protein BC364_20170 [Ensifer sp. LC499]
MILASFPIVRLSSASPKKGLCRRHNAAQKINALEAYQVPVAPHAIDGRIDPDDRKVQLPGWQAQFDFVIVPDGGNER